VSVLWNLWHGCHKISPGCAHCYVYRWTKNTAETVSCIQNGTILFAGAKEQKRAYKISSGEIVYTCFTSDFFVEDADSWRKSLADDEERGAICTFLFIPRGFTAFTTASLRLGSGLSQCAYLLHDGKPGPGRFSAADFYGGADCPKKHYLRASLEAVDLSAYLGKWAKEVVAGGESAMRPAW
jgi:hypothetical protein